jgi:hypothetical protein
VWQPGNCGTEATYMPSSSRSMTTSNWSAIFLRLHRLDPRSRGGAVLARERGCEHDDAYGSMKRAQATGGSASPGGDSNPDRRPKANCRSRRNEGAAIRATARGRIHRSSRARPSLRVRLRRAGARGLRA